MKFHSSVWAIAAALLATGCASGPPFIDAMQPEALSMATRRAQFELNCPAATGEVLSRETVEPLVFAGPLRAEYTIGVAGCGQRATYIVMCSQNNFNCFAGGGRTAIQQ
jgi:hypothetical protein